MRPWKPESVSFSEHLCCPTDECWDSGLPRVPLREKLCLACQSRCICPRYLEHVMSQLLEVFSYKAPCSRNPLGGENVFQKMEWLGSLRKRARKREMMGEEVLWRSCRSSFHQVWKCLKGNIWFTLCHLQWMVCKPELCQWPSETSGSEKLQSYTEKYNIFKGGKKFA